MAIASAQPGMLLVCDKALLSGFLAADPADPRLVWLVGSDGSRIDVNWPRGFAVRFDPEPALITPAGGVAARAGQRVDLVGGFSSRDGHFNACEVNGRNWAGWGPGDPPPPTANIRVLP